MKAVVATFNQEKALVGAFSVITNLRMKLFEALVATPQAPCVPATAPGCGCTDRRCCTTSTPTPRSPRSWSPAVRCTSRWWPSWGGSTASSRRISTPPRCLLSSERCVMFFPCRGYNHTSPFEDSNVFNSDLCTLYSYSRILYPVLDEVVLCWCLSDYSLILWFGSIPEREKMTLTIGKLILNRTCLPHILNRPSLSAVSCVRPIHNRT